jgi:hypothetical protein
MLWPIVEPFEITCCILGAVIVAATILSALLKWKTEKTFWFSLLFAVVAFVPSCAAIKHVYDQERFGIFHYATYSDVKDRHVAQSLPPAATDITVQQEWMGCRAKYRITEAELDAYTDQLWARSQQAKHLRDEADVNSTLSPANLEFHFGELGWPMLQDAKEYDWPFAKNGAGSWIWYSKSTGIAYQRAGYW